MAGHSALETVGRARHALGDDGYVGVLVSDRRLLGSELTNVGAERYKETLLPWNSAVLMAGGPFTKWLRGRVMVFGGTGPIYDSEDPRTGLLANAQADLGFQPVSRVSLEVGARAQTIRERTGETHSEGWVTHARLEVYAARALWGRLVVDWSDYSESFSSQVLLAWEGSPGQAVYVGASLETTAWEPPSWQVFSKVSWRFSL